MNVIHVNLELKMGMNVSIILIMDEKTLIEFTFF